MKKKYLTPLDILEGNLLEIKLSIESIRNMLNYTSAPRVTARYKARLEQTLKQEAEFKEAIKLLKKGGRKREKLQDGYPN